MFKSVGRLALSLLITTSSLLPAHLFAMGGEEEYGPSSSTSQQKPQGLNHSKSSPNLQRYLEEQVSTSKKLVPLIVHYHLGQSLASASQCQTEQKTSGGLDKEAIEKRLKFSTDVEKLSEPLVLSLIKTCPKDLKIIIEKFRNRHRIANCTLPKSIVLVGPSGVGKSEISRAIAQNLSFDIHFIRAAFLGDEYKKSSEQDLQRLIEPFANNAEKPTFIVFDEMQALTAGHKNKDKSSDFGVGIAFWSLVDKYKKNPKVFFIGTINDEEDIPEQFRTRTTLIHISLPDQEARKRILSFHLSLIEKGTSEESGTILDESCKDAVEELSYATSRFTGRDLVTLVNNSVGFAIQREQKENSLSASTLTLKKDDLMEAFDELKSEVYTHEYAQLLPWKKMEKGVEKSLPFINLALQCYVTYKQITSQTLSFRYQRLFNMISIFRGGIWARWTDSKSAEILQDFEKTEVNENQQINNPEFDLAQLPLKKNAVANKFKDIPIIGGTMSAIADKAMDACGIGGEKKVDSSDVTAESITKGLEKTVPKKK